jgi:hypothetical protein
MMDLSWAERWRRLGEANARARAERLRRMSLEEALARFEELCRTVHRQFDRPPVRRTHAVGLVKSWKRR